MKSFVNCYQSSANEITHIYIEDGISKTEKVKFKPFLGIEAMKSENSSWTDIFGKPLKVKVFDSIMEMKEWKKENKDILKIYGDISTPVMFLATQYRNDIPFQKEGLKVLNYDIEVDVPSNAGFPRPEQAKFPVNAICVQKMFENEYTLFGLKDCEKIDENTTYIKCDSEQDLLEKFLDWNEEYNPQILTGWNIQTFDIPYLTNRINRILGPEQVKRLSPDRVLKQRTIKFGNNELSTYDYQGVIIWDYIEIYKKYIGEPRESFSLDSISKHELGDSKVSYSEDYESLSNLYNENPQLFYEYNKKDVELVYELNNKLGFIELAMSIAHKAKCQPESIFGTVAPWDAIFYNELLKIKKLCPPVLRHDKQEFPGGFVKDPQAGLHEWVMVFDIVSSYPNQIISSNLSPETVIAEKDLTPQLRKIRAEYNSIESCIEIDKLEHITQTLKDHNVTYCANGQFFRTDFEGFIPKIYSKIFNERVEQKALLKKLKNDGKTEEAKKVDLIQYALKILLNSGYGGLANQHSRWFDIRIASAITCDGQVCVRGSAEYLKKHLNISNVYSDTDSNFLNLNDIVKLRFKENIPSQDKILDFLLKYNDKFIQPALDDYFEKLATTLNMRRKTIKMEAECIADVSLHVAKKRYIMSKVWDEGTFHLDKPKLKVRGVEIVRTSTPMWCRDKLKEAVGLIFSSKSNDVLIEFIDKSRKEFNQLPFEKVAFPRGVTFSDYTLQSKSLPIHVRASFVYNKLIDHLEIKNHQKISDGDKVKFCFIKEPNKVHSNVIAIKNKFPDEFNNYMNIDYKLQFDKAFLGPIENILEAIGWTYEKKSTLEDFFS